MTGLVPILIPPSGRRSAATQLRRNGPPPMPALIMSRTRSTVYAITGVDGRGRAPDLTVVRALGWTAASNLEARAYGGLIVVVASAEGSLGLTAHGHVRLPASLRRACGIEEGNRVLLAAEPTIGVLVVHPLASLDAMVSDRHSALTTGGAA